MYPLLKTEYVHINLMSQLVRINNIIHSACECMVIIRLKIETVVADKLFRSTRSEKVNSRKLNLIDFISHFKQVYMHSLTSCLNLVPEDGCPESQKDYLE